jgi:hypothetical protein
MFQLSDLNNDHWIFQGSLSTNGYGQIYYLGKVRRVHRVSAHLFLDFYEEYQVNHKCEFKTCWNPEHIYVGTAQENTQDIVRPFKIHCKYGHTLTDDNIYLSKTGAKNCKICAKERAKQHYYDKL